VMVLARRHANREPHREGVLEHFASGGVPLSHGREHMLNIVPLSNHVLRPHFRCQTIALCRLPSSIAMARMRSTERLQQCPERRISQAYEITPYHGSQPLQ
jgi:hypothetical protein